MKNNLRIDLKHIANLIEEKSHIMEIGCGYGLLLAYLSNVKKIDGAELKFHKVG